VVETQGRPGATRPAISVSGPRGTFWKESWNQEQGLGVGPSVLTDLCTKALQIEGKAMRKLVIMFAVVGLSGTAFAQAKKGEAAAKVKVYDFSGDTIEGDLVKPEGSTVDARDFAKHSSLIRIRKDFIPEIIKSAEDL
jgi:hypothetical protein